MNSNIISATIKIKKNKSNKLIFTKRNGTTASCDIGVDLIKSPWHKL